MLVLAGVDDELAFGTIRVAVGTADRVRPEGRDGTVGFGMGTDAIIVLTFGPVIAGLVTATQQR